MIDNELKDLAHLNVNYWLKQGSRIFCMQDGTTPAIVASRKGHTETLALLLANKADVNSEDKLQKFNLLSCL